MQNYTNTYQQIHFIISQLCHSMDYESMPIPEIVTRIKRHKSWPQLITLMSSTNEIIALAFKKSNSPVSPVLVRPIFKEGFKENFFASRDHVVLEEIERINFDHKSHWTNDFLQKLYTIDAVPDGSIHKAFSLALEMIKEMENVVLVSGPVAAKTFEERMSNLYDFDFALRKAKREGYNVFNYLPFEDLFLKIYDIHSDVQNGCPEQLAINHFLFPLMETGKIRKLLLLFGWQDSFVANQLQLKAIGQGIAIEEYDPEAIVLTEADQDEVVVTDSVPENQN